MMGVVGYAPVDHDHRGLAHHHTSCPKGRAVTWLGVASNSPSDRWLPP